jgi:GWxTD domain-containing protein
MKNKAISLFFLVLVLAFVVTFSSIAQQSKEEKKLTQEQINNYIDNWLDSPVKYIITDKESDTYKKLKDREDKIRFINYFWLRRDPDTETAVNEFKDEYFKRVMTSNYHFKVGSEEGWKTSRGQIFCVFGPPQELHRGVTPSLNSYEIWTYDRLPSRALSSYYSIVFVDWYGNRDYKIAYGDYIGQTAFERRMGLLGMIAGADNIPPEVVNALEDMKKLYIVNKDLKLEDVPAPADIGNLFPF